MVFNGVESSRWSSSESSVRNRMIDYNVWARSVWGSRKEIEEDVLLLLLKINRSAAFCRVPIRNWNRSNFTHMLLGCFMFDF
jgi:hypothetical protein